MGNENGKGEFRENGEDKGRENKSQNALFHSSPKCAFFFHTQAMFVHCLCVPTVSSIFLKVIWFIIAKLSFHRSKHFRDFIVKIVLYYLFSSILMIIIIITRLRFLESVISSLMV